MNDDFGGGSTFPGGYTCGSCGQFVGWNTQHLCSGIQVRTSGFAPSMPQLTEDDVRRIVREEIRASVRSAARRLLPGRGDPIS